MKLLRYGPAGFEKPGLLDRQGRLRDLSGVVEHVTSEHLSAKGLAKLAKIKPESLPLVRGKPRLGVPYAGISKFIAIGLNYADHAAESGRAGAERADPVLEGDHLHQRPERRHRHPAQLDQDRLGSRARRRHRHQGAVRAPRTRRSITSPATA